MSDNPFMKFLELVKPQEPFNNESIPPIPNYENIDNWAATPSIDGQQLYVPDATHTVNKDNNPVDVFYIHPTGFYEKRWNSDMNKNKSAFERTEIMLGNQASVFNDSCNIFCT